jgi:small subunit ribosomal protein S16
MAVKIRLKRTGTTNEACFRVVAADARSPRDGRNLENLGWYTPNQPGINFKLKLDRIDHWIGNGAQVSDTVASLIRKSRKLAANAPVEEEKASVEEVKAPVETETAAVQEEAAEEVPAVTDAG